MATFKFQGNTISTTITFTNGARSKASRRNQELVASPMLPWQVTNPWAHQQQVDTKGSICQKGALRKNSKV
jgi:hypothetical protein